MTPKEIAANVVANTKTPLLEKRDRLLKMSKLRRWIHDAFNPERETLPEIERLLKNVEHSEETIVYLIENDLLP